MKLDLLEVLLRIRSHYTELIVHSAPKTDPEVDEVRRLVQLRDQLTTAANQIIEGQMAASVTGVEEAQAELGRLEEDLAEVARRLADVRRAIELGLKVLTVVAHVVSLVRH
jgi:hypothetical protein